MKDTLKALLVHFLLLLANTVAISVELIALRHVGFDIAAKIRAYYVLGDEGAVMFAAFGGVAITVVQQVVLYLLAVHCLPKIKDTISSEALPQISESTGPGVIGRIKWLIAMLFLVFLKLLELSALKTLTGVDLIEGVVYLHSRHLLLFLFLQLFFWNMFVWLQVNIAGLFLEKLAEASQTIPGTHD
ncbi:hypothetical protein ACFL2T_05455 [Elusimicrobiota bacterium]